jgi:alcohol dehydrogenase (NADP+)
MSTPINPSLVPQRVLYTGAKMPAIGLGTFGSDHASNEAIAKAVVGAAEVGYRHFDCAAVYGNEHLLGKSLLHLMTSGIKREELWMTSKLWNDKHSETDVIPACKKSLEDLGLDYLDLYLIHWPFPNHHAQGVDVSSRDHQAKAYSHETYMKTWRQMETLVDMGLVRHIGTSNMTIPKLELLLRDARIKPAVNEMELHPHFQQPELFKFVRDNNMEAIGYCPLGSPNRPERDRTPEDTNPLEDSVVVEIAKRLELHPATVCIKWAVQRGQAAIPMSTNRKNYLANLQATLSEPLTNADMKALEAIDKNNRLIKGQVFLWKEHQDWQDLWDINGKITPP